MRPQIKPGLSWLQRDAETVQFGLDPDHAVVLTGLNPRMMAVLRNLNGRRSQRAVLSKARSHGVDRRTVGLMLQTLADAGVLADGTVRASLRGLPATERERLLPDLLAHGLAGDGDEKDFRIRRSAEISVYGAGRVGSNVATMLAAAGVGKVTVVDSTPARPGDLSPAGLRTHDVGSPRAAGVCRAIDAVAPSTNAGMSADTAAGTATTTATRATAKGATTTGVTASGTTAPGETALPEAATGAGAGEARGEPAGAAGDGAAGGGAAGGGEAAAGVAAVPARVAVLAPDHEADRKLADQLMRAGVPHLMVRVRETKGIVGPFVLPGTSSCLRCHDMQRTARDPAWPTILAQLLAMPARPYPCDLVLATATACLAAAQVLAFLDGHVPPAVDRTLEIWMPLAEVRSRPWTAHPGCPCQFDPFTR